MLFGVVLCRSVVRGFISLREVRFEGGSRGPGVPGTTLYSKDELRSFIVAQKGARAAHGTVHIFYRVH